MISRVRQYWECVVYVTIILGICVVLSNNVKADSLMDVIYTEEETRENHSEAYAMQRGRGAFLAGGTAMISEVGVGELDLFGSTEALEDCFLTLIMYLERKTGETYSTYQYWEFYEDNTPVLSRSIDILVPRGSFYRLATYHAAKKGVTRESAGALTLGIWIE